MDLIARIGHSDYKRSGRSPHVALSVPPGHDATIWGYLYPPLWKTPQLHKQAPFGNTLIKVQPEKPRCDLATRRQRFDDESL